MNNLNDIKEINGKQNKENDNNIKENNDNFNKCDNKKTEEVTRLRPNNNANDETSRRGGKQKEKNNKIYNW